MSTSRPSFSVAIPCYNYGRYLDAAVGAALAQRDVDVNVLIIDDCSSDDTPEIGRRLAEDPRVTYTRHEQNKGHIATFSEGVDWATDEFFVLVSADDLLAPGAFSRAARAFRAHPSVGLVYGGVVRFADTVEPSDCGDPDQVTVYRGWDWIERRCKAADNSTHSPEIFLRTSVQQQIGHYDPRCRHTSDLNMWLRAAAVADVAFLEGTVQAYYRVHGANMSRTEHAAKLGQIEQRHIAFETFFETVTPTAETRRLQRMAGHRIATDALWDASRGIERGELRTDSDLEPFLDLARRADPDIESSMAHRGMRLRQRLGPAARFVPFFLLSRAIGLVRRRRAWRTMMQHGI